MKQLLTILLIAPLFMNAQIPNFSKMPPLIDSMWYPFNNNTTPVTQMVLDSTILFNGIDTIAHEHEWLSNDLPYRYSSQSGVPYEAWESICYICLRHYKVEERVVDKFKEAKERLNNIKNKTNARK